ncbi:MAG: hypothetical protein ACFCUM_13260 [Bacteroidales bacterium]
MEHVDAAFENFKANLERFRGVVPLRMVAMQGRATPAAGGMVLR